jgi:polyphosphate kinase 2 (PPK2 family)
MAKILKLSSLLKSLPTNSFSEAQKNAMEEETKELQLQMLRIQQGVFHKKDRVVIMLEGFDAAGKGGTIRKITENLDPRSVKVVPIGAPHPEDQGKHWLYRFWRELPAEGHITIFDRSWYGRVLVEKVEKLTEAEKLKRAHQEINEFEAQLQNDGIVLIKIFLAISEDEQLERFKARINDPYKQWKISMDDIRARKNWHEYVEAVDELFKKTHLPSSPWHLIPANSKRFTRLEVLKILTKKLKTHSDWMEKAAEKYDQKKLLKLLKKI